MAVARLDELYLQGQTYDKCVKNVIDTTLLLDKLELVVLPEKFFFQTYPNPQDSGVCNKFSNNDTTAYQGKSHWLTKGLYRVSTMPISIY